ncbi:MAG: hypothetical protein QM765_19940 [Myxococcales bacterium]
MTTLSPEERKGLLLSVGTHRGRRPLSPIEVATLFKRDLAAGNTTGKLGPLVQLSPTMIGRFVRLLSLSEDIRHLIGWQGAEEGSVSFTSAFENGPAACHRRPPCVGKGDTWAQLFKRRNAPSGSTSVAIGSPYRRVH